MIGYVTIGTNDLHRSKTFYLDVLKDLDAKVIMDIGRLIMIGNDPSQCMLGICTPYNEKEAACGNGPMIAINAGSREKVDALHGKALELGATDEGAPGERMPQFYGAYMRDADGNKVVFYHMG